MNLSKRISVLYAEDDEDASYLVSTLLGFSGIEVTSVRTAAAAFQAAQKRYFDLYLLNSRYSDGNGFDLCWRLRELSPLIPIVLFSGAADKNDRERGLAAGADKYLIKPHNDEIAPAIFELVATRTVAS